MDNHKKERDNLEYAAYEYLLLKRALVERFCGSVNDYERKDDHAGEKGTYASGK